MLTTGYGFDRRGFVLRDLAQGLAARIAHFSGTNEATWGNLRNKRQKILLMPLLPATVSRSLCLSPCPASSSVPTGQHPSWHRNSAGFDYHFTMFSTLGNV